MSNNKNAIVNAFVPISSVVKETETSILIKINVDTGIWVNKKFVYEANPNSKFSAILRIGIVENSEYLTASKSKISAQEVIDHIDEYFIDYNFKK